MAAIKVKKGDKVRDTLLNREGVVADIITVSGKKIVEINDKGWTWFSPLSYLEKL